MDVGHDVNWQAWLTKKGVASVKDAKKEFQNLQNLKMECRGCNVSHAFERDGSGDYAE